MKSLMLLIASVFLLGACAPDGDAGGGAGNGETAPKAPAPAPPVAKAKWGDLRCQKTKTCKDAILNLGVDTIAQFMSRTTPRPERDVPVSFLCGRTLADAWTAVTGQPGHGSKLDVFFALMIEPATCLPYADWNLKLENYFKNHGEFKNEIR